MTALALLTEDGTLALEITQSEMARHSWMFQRLVAECQDRSFLLKQWKAFRWLLLSQNELNWNGVVFNIAPAGILWGWFPQKM